MGARDDAKGKCHNDTLDIRIDPSLPESRQAEVLLHEILHAVFHNMGIDQSENLKSYEEYIVNTISNGLYQVLADNDVDFRQPNRQPKSLESLLSPSN